MSTKVTVCIRDLNVFNIPWIPDLSSSRHHLMIICYNCIPENLISQGFSCILAWLYTCRDLLAFAILKICCWTLFISGSCLVYWIWSASPKKQRNWQDLARSGWRVHSPPPPNLNISLLWPMCVCSSHFCMSSFSASTASYFIGTEEQQKLLQKVTCCFGLWLNHLYKYSWSFLILKFKMWLFSCFHQYCYLKGCVLVILCLNVFHPKD